MKITERKIARPKYFAVEDLNKVICTTQRAGSTSMIESMQPRPGYPESAVRRVEPAEVLKLRETGWPVVLWLRDPLQRFASAYAIFGAGRIPVSREIATLKHRTPALFVDTVLMLDDAHWAPMTRLHSHKGVFLPTRIYPFEDLTETWAKEMSGYWLLYKNRTKRKHWSDLAGELDSKHIEALNRHYEEDLKMLNWCRENGYMENAA